MNTLSFKKYFAVFLLLSSLVSPILAGTLPKNEQARFEALAQHYCYFSYELFYRVLKHQTNNLNLSDHNAVLVAQAKKSVNNQMDCVRENLYTHHDHTKAVAEFGNQVLNLCNKANLKRYGALSFAEKINTRDSLEQQLDQIEEGVQALEKYYATIKPTESWPTYLKQKLLYNFFTTYIVPRILVFGGGVLSVYWLSVMIQKTADDIDENRFKFPIFNYREVDHNNSSYSSNQCDMGPGFVCYRGSNNNRCLQPNGFNWNIPALMTRLAWSSRFSLPGTIAWFLADPIKEAQMPEYERRLLDKQKLEEQKKVEEEMRNMKINREGTITFKSVKGHDTLIKDEIAMYADYLKHPFKYKHNTGTIGILLYGPPGTGKTLIGRAIAGEGTPYLEINADDILHENAKEKILATWRLAEDTAAKRPEKSAIIYIDELDCVVGNRQAGQIDSDRAKALANLLTIFDGIEKRNPFLHILVVLTTNHTSNLDAALLRPGRIDRKIYIGNPDAQGREQFFRELLPKENLAYIPEFVRMSDGMSGAEITCLVQTAQMIAAYNNHPLTTKEDYTAAFKSFTTQPRQI